MSSEQGKLSSAQRFSDFVEVAGRTWATRQDMLDERQHCVQSITLKLQQVSAAEIARRMQDELKDRPQMLQLDQPLPGVAEAKQAVAAGKATLSDRMTLLIHFAASGQRSRVEEAQQSFAQLAQGKAALDWITDDILLDTRKHEELKDRLLAQSTAAASRHSEAAINWRWPILLIYLAAGARSPRNAATDRQVASRLRASTGARAGTAAVDEFPLKRTWKTAAIPTSVVLERKTGRRVPDRCPFAAGICPGCLPPVRVITKPHSTWIRRAMSGDFAWSD